MAVADRRTESAPHSSGVNDPLYPQHTHPSAHTPQTHYRITSLSSFPLAHSVILYTLQVHQIYTIHFTLTKLFHFALIQTTYYTVCLTHVYTYPPTKGLVHTLCFLTISVKKLSPDVNIEVMISFRYEDKPGMVPLPDLTNIHPNTQDVTSQGLILNE